MKWKVSDLAGSQVITETGQQLGELVDVFATGANDVFVVRKDKEEILIPALKSVVLSISEFEKKIVVRLPQGLKEVYESPKN